MTAWCSISIVQVCCTALHVVDWLALLWGEMHQSAICTDCMSSVGWSHGQIDTGRAYCAAVPPEGPSENSGKCSLSSTDLADCKEFQGSRTNVPLMQDNTDLPKFLWWCLENSCPFCSTGRHDPPRRRTRSSSFTLPICQQKRLKTQCQHWEKGRLSVWWIFEPHHGARAVSLCPQWM